MSNRQRDERGYVTVLVALLLMPLMIASAFAVDLGAWHAQAARMQRAVDNAALSGVVWLPSRVTAERVARQVLDDNGWSGDVEFAYPAPNRMSVTITRPATRYFSQAFTFGGQTLTRSATAEFNPPLRIGSRYAHFGSTPSCTGGTAAGCAPANPGFWVAIQGPFTSRERGDPYATRCASENLVLHACTGDANPEFREAGYTYAVEVPADGGGRVLTVEVFDPGYLPGRSPTIADHAYVGVGELNTSFELFAPDGSWLTASTDPSLSLDGRCGSAPGKITRAGTESPGSPYLAPSWVAVCEIVVPTDAAGDVFPLQIRTSGVTTESGIRLADRGNGHNDFAIKAWLAGPGDQPRVYGIGDMSIYTNQNVPQATFDIAEVPDVHAGKKLVIEGFDPGDGNDDHRYELVIRGPGGQDHPCRHTAESGSAMVTDRAVCSIITKETTQSSVSGNYNDRWLRIEIDLPADYTCASDCWWTANYDFDARGSGHGPRNPADRTTWRAFVVGDPVHLVE